jgi:propane monooxygenase coupling protein
VTTYQHPESKYKSDNTASNRAGVTLMNNQIGAVVAQVMSKKDNVTVMYLPSMIRVDAVGRMDFDYDEISEALGEEPGYYDAAQFEENMSTHYVRQSRGRSRVHRLRPDRPIAVRRHPSPARRRRNRPAPRG